MLLSRDHILSAPDLTTEDVEVPEWGGSVRVSAMSGSARDAFGESLVRDANGNIDPSNYRSKLLSKCLVDADGNLLFTDADIVALGKKNAFAILRLFEVAERLNVISANGVEDAKKN